MEKTLDIYPNISKSREIYDYIRKEALLGHLSGKRLAEKKLAAGLGVSRNVVKKAFLRLRREGILDSRKSFGTFI